ncbi:hypothetical protein [Actinomadura roseirufa]|uniref:hypothetical protein n=1 Tax=Actinomadura roseirufa TaxID=2094049 RepID=UPI0010411A00|nr:hypothetical protein [Actinomadura roseirufa]
MIFAVRTGRQRLTTTSDDHHLVVHGSSLFLGKVNANRELSVRNHPGVQIMHIIQGQVVVACDLRVHGTVHADA